MDMFLHAEFRLLLSAFGMGPWRLAVNSVGEPHHFIQSKEVSCATIVEIMV